MMAFLLVEGFRHTSHLGKYACRLLIFASISQIPYALFLERNGNVLFTLLIGLLVLWADARMKNRPLFWICAFGLTALSLLCDWGFVGPVMIFLFHRVQDRRQSIVYPLLLPLCGLGLPALSAFLTTGDAGQLTVLLFALVSFAGSLPLLFAYNGKRGCPLKYFFYAYYPLHLAVLGAAATLLGA